MTGLGDTRRGPGVGLTVTGNESICPPVTVTVAMPVPPSGVILMVDPVALAEMMLPGLTTAENAPA